LHRYSQYYRREHARENWEINNYIEGEKLEMVELWTSRGLDKNTATDVIEKISQYPAFFADIMMKVICTGFFFWTRRTALLAAVSSSPHFFLLILFLLFFRMNSIFRTLTPTPSKLPSPAAVAFGEEQSSHLYQCLFLAHLAQLHLSRIGRLWLRRLQLPQQLLLLLITSAATRRTSPTGKRSLWALCLVFSPSSPRFVQHELHFANSSRGLPSAICPIF